MKAFLTGFSLLTLLTVSSIALSDPLIELIWSSTTGAGTPGTSTIEADKGDILELDVIVRDLDGQGIKRAILEFSWASPDVVAIAGQDCPSPPHAVAGNCYDPLTTVNLSSFLGEIVGPGFAGPIDAVSDLPLELPAFYGPFNPLVLGRITVRVDAVGAYTLSTYYNSSSRSVVTGANKSYQPEAEATIVPPGCG